VVAASKAHQPAREQALGGQGRPGLAGPRAAPPGPETEPVGDAGEGGEEEAGLAADVGALVWGEAG
jgi:hypothetical protein